ncbi:DUF2057 domain-containing protein [Acinetobacter dispersus]|uniref:YccT family protein n=1 Tax=Acinetobacter dispersus TaxID=70348 RepID=UPI001F4A5856|nr:DUF2057 domain-containing protein [Acinetobacter dispersus]MCH7393603.1 DUF2057 domain-containing protein [Acinetobacter dispersus]
MSLRVGVAAFGLLLSSSVFSAVTITAPEEIVILAVNGQEVNSGLIPSKKNNYQVDPGNLTVNVRYREYFEHLNGEHDIVKSGVVTIQAQDLQDNQSYSLGLVNAPKNFDAAKKYADQPTVALYDQNKKLVVQQTGANNEAQPWFTGNNLLSRTLDLTQKNKNNAVNQPAPVYTGTTAQVAATAPVAVTTAATVGTAKTTDQQLAELWQKASKAERQKFMAWLAGQTN